MKKHKELKLQCKDCEKEPEKNEEMSNKNWTVIDNKPCVYCGGKLTLKYE